MPTVKPIPDGMSAVTPHLVCAGAADAMLTDEMPNCGVLEDLFGHSWSVATHTRDLTPAQMDEEFKKMCA